uniref:Uncharacterized protein n=1 Tax=Mucochytrium quahogii TaxID=96639 RepID=A0A7S2WGZ3_9STRA|mmetsp:Transcript_16687/g.27051  ORF Transcript_16687/g.27051 Transcript_16687/m.27051 type:complete len:317 (+) Transcript_16687:129-1079(+)|eukprot:CAMPEP_0203749690 /NCGR_PEP_ID=MMETSP0098-20131031/4148_1 /ASSEMBLY_ACC=CAM_ASM_000208 /TAXON_ID=96639 /ORGANISM=" , Strain NY0313808BC1" /LENGTH=316 /DNA_ID=CAMNT_0050638783 /DNA_START=89 /DNA_END=1039 /DNA_ORIENTATION=-
MLGRGVLGGRVGRRDVCRLLVPKSVGVESGLPLEGAYLLGVRNKFRLRIDPSKYVKQKEKVMVKVGDFSYERVGKEKVDNRDMRNRFSKNNLKVDKIAATLRESSVVFFVQGDIDVESKILLKKLGFSAERVKSKLIKIAAARLDPEQDSTDEVHLNTAEALSRGVTTLVSYQNPLLSLLTVPNVLTEFTNMLPLETPKNGIYKESTYMVIAAFIRDNGKLSPDIWLSRAGVKALVDTLEKYAGSFPPPQGEDATQHEPHAVFHANLVSALQNQMGAIRQPLTAPGSAVSSAISNAPQAVLGVFSQIKALKEEENK